MHEKIARDPRPVVPVVAPAEDPERVVRTVGRRPKEALPVHRLLGGLVRDRILPCSDGIVARPEPLRVVEFADGPGLEQLLRLLVAERAHPLAAHLENAARFLLRADQIVTLADRVDHRLLAVHGLAGPERRNRNRLVPVVGRPHDHRVDIVAGEHLGVVARREDLPVAFARGIQAAIEDIARRHEFDPGDPQRGIHIGHSHSPGPDHGQTHTVRRRHLSAPRLAAQRPADCTWCLGRQQGREPRGECGTGRDGLDELSPATGRAGLRTGLTLVAHGAHPLEVGVRASFAPVPQPKRAPIRSAKE